MAVDALSYFALAAALLAVRAERVIAGEVGDPSRLLKQLRTLVAYPRVMALLLITFVFFLLYGPVEVAIPVLVNSTLAAGPESLGLVWTAFGLGAVLGSFAAGLLQRTPVLAGCVAVVALWGAIIVAAAFASSTAQLGAALFIGGLVFGPYNPLSISFIQAEVDLADLAPVNAAWASALLAATPVGVLLGGPLVTAVGPSATLLSMGLGTVLAALLGVGLLTRSRRGRA